MSFEKRILVKIGKFMENIIRIIPVAGNDTPLADESNGSIGVSLDYARSDHKHPLPEGLIDSSWTTLTVDGNFYNYTESNTALLPLQYRKIGKIVEVIGIVGLNDDLAVGEWTIGTLPVECRPTKEMSFVCELYNNSNLWTCIIKTDGKITFNRLRDINSSVNVTVTYTDSTTETVSLAKATSYIAGTKWVDALKVNVMFLV